MRNIFFVIAVVLAVVWVISFFILSAGLAIHILIILAVFFWLHAIISSAKEKVPSKSNPDPDIAST